MTKVFVNLPMAHALKATRMKASALSVGGNEPTPAQDHGFMCQRTFEDLGGHI
jgi:predicted lactoylglutathione lyase